MGTYRQGIYGPYSGRVGNVIGSFWKGRCIMRIRAASFTDANTIPQQTQRMKWRIVSAFVKANEKLVKLGFAAADATLTAFNSAMKHNLPEAISGTFPTLSLNFEKAKLSMGNLLGLSGYAATAATPGTVKVDWTDNSNNEDAFATDRLMLSVIDTTSGEVFLNPTQVTRADETTVITLPTGWAGRQVHVLGFFVKDGQLAITSKDQVSTSDSIGSVTVG